MLYIMQSDNPNLLVQTMDANQANATHITVNTRKSTNKHKLAGQADILNQLLDPLYSNQIVNNTSFDKIPQKMSTYHIFNMLPF